MAYTKEISRGTPKYIGQEGKRRKFSIPITFVVKKDGNQILTVSDDIIYTEGQDPKKCLNKIQEKIQEKVNIQKAVLTLSTNKKVDNALQILSNNINL